MSKSLAFCLGVAVLSVGCAGKPAAPFDTLKTSNLTAYRLQNYEQPAAAAAATPGAAPAIPGLPPEITSWIQQGAAGLQQLIPPGLQIPGLQLPGAPAITPAVDTTPRFHTFRILSQTQVIDSELKESLGELLGEKDNFDNAQARCAPNVFYAEMGLSFGGAVGGTTNDLLVSFSCNQIVSRTFSWPHPSTGMKTDTVKELSEIVQKIFPQGT